MYNLQGIISKGTNNALIQFERLGEIANNLSNVNTNGYKKVCFSDILKEDGYVTGAVRVDRSQGSIRATGNQFDIAIDGTGYIPVVSETGEVQYTRDGAFRRNKEGYLTTSDGLIVGDGIKIPANCIRFDIKQNGEVLAFDEASGKSKKIGTIPLIRFDNPDGMEQADMNRLIATEDAGEGRIVKGHECFKQGNLERANVNVHQAANEMLRLNASMLASLQMLKMVNTMYDRAIQIRQ